LNLDGWVCKVLTGFWTLDFFLGWWVFLNDMPKSLAVMISPFAARLVCLAAFVIILEGVAHYRSGIFKVSGAIGDIVA
jgi:hypothetical protein